MPAKTLKQIYDESISLAKLTPPKLIQKGTLYKWKGTVGSFVIGELKFSGSPYFCLNIFDESHVLPCLLLDPVRNLKRLLTFYGHVVLSNAPELIAEIFVINNQEYALVYMLFDTEKAHIIEKNIRQFSLTLKNSKNHSSCGNLKNVTCEWKQKFVPLKVSSTLLSLKSELYCFILALFINSDEDYKNGCNNLVWIILRNKQIVWKDLLLPNHIYSIVVPEYIPTDYFTLYNSLISIVDENLDITFHQILHHKDFIRTNAAVFLPEQSKIFVSFCDPLFVAPVERWFSVSDSKLGSLKFASIFGVIKEIKYFDSFKSKNCLWCSCGNAIFEATLKEPVNSGNKAENSFDWSCPASFHDEENTDLFLPDILFDVPHNEKIGGFGVRGGRLCIQITLQGFSSQDVTSVFLKRWQLQQYPAGLVKGVTVCFTDINVKRSAVNKFYFVCTPFTRILHLNSNADQRLIATPIEHFKFGFPFTQRETEKIWGILELDLPLKVSISAKCKSCHYSFVHYSCSNAFCPKYRLLVGAEYDVVASARLFIHNFKGSQMSILYLKNENVQKYLGIPSRIWRYFCELSANAQFLYLHQREETEHSNRDAMAIFFHLYCKYFRPKRRYHVLCKQFKDDSSRYFCLELEEVTEERLGSTRSAFEKLIKDSGKNNVLFKVADP